MFRCAEIDSSWREQQSRPARTPRLCDVYVFVAVGPNSWLIIHRVNCQSVLKLAVFTESFGVACQVERTGAN